MVKFMKRNPEIFMDLISEHRPMRFGESTYKRLDDDYPYMESNSNTATIPTQYIDSKLFK